MTKSMLTVVALLAGAGVARADARADLEGQIGTFASWARQKVWTADGVKNAKPVADCIGALAAARKAGVADDAELEIYAVDQIMEAPKRGVHSGTRMVAVKDAGKVCDAYANALAAQSFTSAVRSAFELEEWMKLVKPAEVPSTTTGMEKKPEACIAAIDARLAGGAAPGDAIEVDGQRPTLAEAKTRCQQILVDARTFQEVVNERIKAEAERRAAKYRAAGIKGPRLELFAYYDMEWYYPGCRSSTGDPAKLKKAKALFQWLTAPDGTITIRKFTFTGDKYRQTEKYFATEAAAYRGCR